MLVRAKDDFVDRFIPTDMDGGTGAIFNAITREFGVALIAQPEDLHLFGEGEL